MKRYRLQLKVVENDVFANCCGPTVETQVE